VSQLLGFQIHRPRIGGIKYISKVFAKMSGSASAKAPVNIVFSKSFASCHAAKTFEKNYIFRRALGSGKNVSLTRTAEYLAKSELILIYWESHYP